MGWKIIFFMLIGHFCFGQPDVLFDELMENRPVFGVIDRSDSALMAKIIREYPNSQQALFCKAYFSLMSSDGEICHALTDTLLKKYSGLTPYAFVLRGVLFEAMGDAQQAMDNYNSALRTSPGFLLALGHRGLLNYQMNSLFAAENDFKQILRVRGEDLDFMLNLAAVKLAQSDLDNSYLIFKQVVDAAYGNASLLSEAYSGMAQSKLLAFEYMESLNLFQNSIKYNPQNGDAYYQMGLIKKYLKDIPGGCQDLLAAKKLGVKVTSKELKGCKRK